MIRTTRQHLDEGILDHAAALFARRGFASTSLQAVADAAGYSKAGLLHHFPSKDALRRAVLDEAHAVGRRVADGVAALPAGEQRDRAVVATIVDIALARPGLVALLLGSTTASDDPAAGDAVLSTIPGGGEPGVADLTAISGAVFEAFGVDVAVLADGGAAPPADVERVVRVTGALAAVAVLALAAHDTGATTAWRPHIVATAVAALGHPS